MAEKKWVRYLVGAAAIWYIVYMWMDKNLLDVYADMPKEQLIPMIVTSAGVTLLKIALLSGIILAVKWIAGKLSGRK